MKKRRDMVCVRKREIWSEMISFGVFLLVNVVCCLLFRHGGVYKQVFKRGKREKEARLVGSKVGEGTELSWIFIFIFIYFS
jgi:ribose/xylose/arabinose/galactoside ABC-type transport system permease subunit